MGKPEQAIELYNKAIRLCPFPPSYYYLNFGNAYRAMGRYEKAIAEYKNALHLTPKNVLAFIGLAVCYCLSGLWEQSRKAADEVLKLNSNYSIKVFMKSQSTDNKELMRSWSNALRKAGIPAG